MICDLCEEESDFESSITYHIFINDVNISGERSIAICPKCRANKCIGELYLKEIKIRLQEDNELKKFNKRS